MIERYSGRGKEQSSFLRTINQLKEGGERERKEKDEKNKKQ
jgi:hypothetical protein